MRLWVEPELGRLARWLRLLGYDAPLKRAPWSRPAPGEALLTRRRRLAGRPGVVVVLADRLDGQLAQVRGELALTPDPARFFSRCLACNLPVEPLVREQARGLVPEHTFHTAESFTRCPGCGRIFWPGSHGERARERLAKLLARQGGSHEN